MRCREMNSPGYLDLSLSELRFLDASVLAWWREQPVHSDTLTWMDLDEC